MGREHTPGPWVATPSIHKEEWEYWIDSIKEGDVRGKMVAAIAVNPQAVSDSRLIAAAPDMLEALVCCEVQLEDIVKAGASKGLQTAYLLAVDAVAKARNETAEVSEAI